MTTTLQLICIASTASSRQARFPEKTEPLDEAGRRAAANARLADRYGKSAQCSPACSAVATAQAMGLQPIPQPALADIDHGSWSGLAFEQIGARHLDAWLADPIRGTPDGETLDQARDRIGMWLDGVAGQGGAVCAISHPMMMRAAIAHALAMPLSSALAIDIAPLSRAVLSFNRRWRLQSLGPDSQDVPSP